MKDKIKAGASDRAKDKSEKSPRAPAFTENQDASGETPQRNIKKAMPSEAAPHQKPLLQKEFPEEKTHQAVRANDEVMSHASESNASKVPRIDSNLQVARLETAQEVIHEVMSKDEARKLEPEKSKKVSRRSTHVKHQHD